MIFWIPNFKSVESLESRNCLEFFDSSQFLDIGHKVFWYIYHSTQWKKMEYIFPDFWMIDSWPIRKLENGGIFEKYDGGKVLSAIDFCHWACAHRSPWPRSPRLGHPKSYFMTHIKNYLICSFPSQLLHLVPSDLVPPEHEVQSLCPLPWQFQHRFLPLPWQGEHIRTFSVWGTRISKTCSVNGAGSVTWIDHGDGGGPLNSPSTGPPKYGSSFQDVSRFSVQELIRYYKQCKMLDQMVYIRNNYLICTFLDLPKSL